MFYFKNNPERIKKKGRGWGWGNPTHYLRIHCFLCWKQTQILCEKHCMFTDSLFLPLIQLKSEAE